MGGRFGLAVVIGSQPACAPTSFRVISVHR